MTCRGMVIDPADEDDGETQDEREDRRRQVPECKPQLASRTDRVRRRNLDVDDEQRERDSKDSIAKGFEP